MYTLQTPDQLSAYLRSLRKSRGLTQRALGAMLGVSAARIAAIERRPGAVGIGKLLDLLHLLGARLYLDDGTNERNGVADSTGHTHRTSAGEW